jgi:RNA polymerase sigma-70 factor (ECF subfamily)
VERVSRSRTPVAADEVALRRLWDEHAGPLLAFVIRLNGGDRGAAEDVVHETLLRAWQRPEVLDPAHGPLRPWLLAVARGLVGDSTDPALDRRLVADALASLSPVHREALLHTYYAGRTADEAARTLGVPTGTVKSRVLSALRALGSALEERGVTT